MSRELLFPFAVVVCGQVLYHVLVRYVPRDVSPLLLYSITYGMAAIVMLLSWVLLPVGSREARGVAGTAVWGLGIGVAVLLVELGYIYAYRGGLSLAFGPLAVFAVTTAALVPLSAWVFGEDIRPASIAGVILVGIGAWLILNPSIGRM